MKKIEINLETLREINRKHNEDNASLNSLESEYGISRKTIKRLFDENELDYRSKGVIRKSKYSEDFVRGLYDEYSEGSSTVVLGQKYGMTAPQIWQLFKRYGFEIRSNTINSRRYKYNDNFFELIDTEEKAYWLGFIYADGYIARTERRLQLGIALSSIDKGHLEKFVKSIDGDIEVKTYKAGNNQSFCNDTEYSRVIVSNNKMCEDLISHGVFEHKSNILQAPKINESLIKHFIRGYLDGDGSISFSKNSCTVSFLGTDELLTFIGEYFISRGLTSKAVNLEKRELEQVVSYIRYGGNRQVLTILKHLYDDCTIYLDRKEEKYRELCRF